MASIIIGTTNKNFCPQIPIEIQNSTLCSLNHKHKWATKTKTLYQETTMSFTASLVSSLTAPSFVSLDHLPPSFFLPTTLKPTSLTHPQPPRLSSTYGMAAKAATANDVVPETAPTSASEVVSSFYAAVNVHDLSSVTDLIAQDCVYEDLVFSSPFVGRKVKRFFSWTKISSFTLCCVSEPNLDKAMTGNSRFLRKIHWINKYGSPICDWWYLNRRLFSCWSFMAFRLVSKIFMI